MDKELLKHIEGMELCAPRLLNRFAKLRQMLNLPSLEETKLPEKYIIIEKQYFEKIHNILPLKINHFTIACWHDLKNVIDISNDPGQFFVSNKIKFFSDSTGDYMQIQNGETYYLIESKFYGEMLKFEEDKIKSHKLTFNDNIRRYFLSLNVNAHILNSFKDNNKKEFTFDELFKFIKNSNEFITIKQKLVLFFWLNKKEKYSMNFILHSITDIILKS